MSAAASSIFRWVFFFSLSFSVGFSQWFVTSVSDSRVRTQFVRQTIPHVQKLLYRKFCRFEFRKYLLPLYNKLVSDAVLRLHQTQHTQTHTHKNLIGPKENLGKSYYNKNDAEKRSRSPFFCTQNDLRRLPQIEKVRKCFNNYSDIALVSAGVAPIPFFFPGKEELMGRVK